MSNILGLQHNVCPQHLSRFLSLQIMKQLCAIIVRHHPGLLLQHVNHEWTNSMPLCPLLKSVLYLRCRSISIHKTRHNLSLSSRSTARPRVMHRPLAIGTHETRSWLGSFGVRWRGLEGFVGL